MKTTPVSALQVEMGEMPMKIRREQIAVTYWANIKGHSKNYPPYLTLKPCQEKEKKNTNSFGWVILSKIEEIGIDKVQVSSVVVSPAIPPWVLEQAEVDLKLLEKGREMEKNEVENYINKEYSKHIQVYTDASKKSNNQVGIAFIAPDLNVMENKRISDKLTVYTGELMAILIALEWIEGIGKGKFVICSDSSSALMSIQGMKSEVRQDIIEDIVQVIFRIKKNGSQIKLIWIPAHIGVVGNELADNFAKRASNKEIVELNIKMSRNEIKSVVKEYMKEKWQEQWDRGEKGRFYYKIQKRVGGYRKGNRTRREEDIISRIRFRHTKLNSTLKLINKHSTGCCEYCGEMETIQHVFLECNKYVREREMLVNEMNNCKLDLEEIFQKSSGDIIFESVFRFLRRTGIMGRV
ncbi:uncharacterized protein LOC111608710 [Xiphophorus maculatus]|uniref:uncharacterized protein LOC111608710 n=1 Tax=Xiphophorus maculatus TaxID=8083 RepID=UPI000C6D390D|nr:uncharacterized protein LOC111608710 [Xiphophorus maculatus]XP_023190357.1 uncharacterized protein LOC111608710 [Xiphophorus maculatus]